MAVTIPSKLAVGDGVTKTFLDAVVDAISGLDSSVSLFSSGVPNGSFEVDDGAGEPANWTMTDTAGGSHALDAADSKHGTQSLEMTATAGGGWVSAENDTFVLCFTGQRIQLDFAYKSTVATVRLRAQVIFYQENASTVVSTASIMDSATGLSAAWKKVSGIALAPSNAAYYKVKFIVGESGGSVAGVINLDAVMSKVFHGMVYQTRATLTPSGTTYTVAPGGGEIPKAALIEAKLEGDGTTFTTWTLSGDGKTVFVVVMAIGDTETYQLITPLNSDGEFTLSWSGGSPTDTVMLVGYEV